MKRLLIFAFLGPVVGLVACALALAIFGLIHQPSHSFPEAVGVFTVALVTGLPLAFLLGGIPALLAGALFVATSNLIAKGFKPSSGVYLAIGAAIGLAVSAAISIPTESKDLMGLLIVPGTVAGALLGWHLRPKTAVHVRTEVWAATKPTDSTAQQQ